MSAPFHYPMQSMTSMKERLSWNCFIRKKVADGIKMKKTLITVEINEKPMELAVTETSTVSDVLHNTLGLTGTKVCCGLGICKACTYIFTSPKEPDFQKAQACLMPMVQMNGCKLTTIEGLAKNGVLTPLQKSFLTHFSFQCGYSTAGFLMSATHLLQHIQKNPIKIDDIDKEIEKAVGDHFCRCTGYKKYYEAIREVLVVHCVSPA